LGSRGEVTFEASDTTSKIQIAAAEATYTSKRWQLLYRRAGDVGGSAAHGETPTPPYSCVSRVPSSIGSGT
jgi:hypothetical protein